VAEPGQNKGAFRTKEGLTKGAGLRGLWLSACPGSNRGAAPAPITPSSPKREYSIAPLYLSTSCNQGRGLRPLSKPPTFLHPLNILSPPTTKERNLSQTQSKNNPKAFENPGPRMI